jgi:hypothetical protein
MAASLHDDYVDIGKDIMLINLDLSAVGSWGMSSLQFHLSEILVHTKRTETVSSSNKPEYGR